MFLKASWGSSFQYLGSGSGLAVEKNTRMNYVGTSVPGRYRGKSGLDRRGRFGF